MTQYFEYDQRNRCSLRTQNESMFSILKMHWLFSPGIHAVCMVLSNMEHLVKAAAASAKWQHLEVGPQNYLEFDEIMLQ